MAFQMEDQSEYSKIHDTCCNKKKTITTRKLHSLPGRNTIKNETKYLGIKYRQETHMCEAHRRNKQKSEGSFYSIISPPVRTKTKPTNQTDNLQECDTAYYPLRLCRMGLCSKCRLSKRLLVSMRTASERLANLPSPETCGSVTDKPKKFKMSTGSDIDITEEEDDEDTMSKEPRMGTWTRHPQEKVPRRYNNLDTHAIKKVASINLI
uniref:Uncharacterized protein n=1 Tax=Timema genevievae TaxID=629358 RepID=A0A7R9JXY7_TIMGE|nr:unnamed protein product [Timema genevievae]